MKKATLSAIVNYLSDNLPYAEENEKDFLQTAINEINAELTKGEAKAQANRDLYAQAHDVIIAMMAKLTEPAPLSEIFNEVKSDLPEGFTKGKMQYAITRLWSDEIVKTEGKVNTYALKV